MNYYRELTEVRYKREFWKQSKKLLISFGWSSFHSFLFLFFSLKFVLFILYVIIIAYNLRTYIYTNLHKRILLLKIYMYIYIYVGDEGDTGAF